MVTLIFNQNGVVDEVDKGFRKLLRRGRPADTGTTGAPVARVQIAPRTLAVSGLTQKFGGFTALTDVSLEVGPGEVVGLLGPNGAGKTTLIDCVAGNNRLTAGSVTWDGQDITRWAPYRRARAGLSRSFQSLELFDDLTVRENLLAAADPRDRLAFVTDLVRPGPAAAARARRRRGRRAVARPAPGRPRRGPVLRPAPARGDRPRGRVVTRRCCCSTSRPPASTRPRAPSSAG